MPVAILLVTLLALLATPVLGVIYNITVPDRLWAGQAFTATLQESESPVTYNEFGVASPPPFLHRADGQVVFGLRDLSVVCDGCEGTQINYTDLSNEPFQASLDLQIVVPDYFEGSYTLVAGIPYLVGVSGETSFKYFEKNVTVQKLLGQPPPKCPPLPCEPITTIIERDETADVICATATAVARDFDMETRETPSIVCPLVGSMTAAPALVARAPRAVPNEIVARRDDYRLRQRQGRSRSQVVEERQCALHC